MIEKLTKQKSDMKDTQLHSLPPIDRKHVERALYALCVDNHGRCKNWLLKALSLSEVVPERKCSYTWRKKPCNIKK